jgi:hypothetical protein
MNYKERLQEIKNYFVVIRNADINPDRNNILPKTEWLIEQAEKYLDIKDSYVEVVLELQKTKELLKEYKQALEEIEEFNEYYSGEIATRVLRREEQ